MTQLQIELRMNHTVGDVSRAINTTWREPTFDAIFETTLTIGTTLTEIKHHLSTIEFVMIVPQTDSVVLEVHKNLSPEYWSVEDAFVVFTTDIEHLALKSNTADTDVYVYLGGSE